MNVYSHVGLDEKARAVASIPAPRDHQRDGERHQPKDEEDGSGEAVAAAEPKLGPMPSGAQNGALILALNGPELASNGTEGLTGGAEDLDLAPTPNSLLPETFGREWHPLTPIVTAPQMAAVEVRPEGLNPQPSVPKTDALSN